MPRTVLEIAKEAAERDATAPAPTVLFGTNDRIARILRGAIKDTMREYMRGNTWSGMSELHSQWAFTLRAGVYAYRLPPDFLRMIPRTEQRDGWPMGLVGPATPQAWAAWLYGGSSVVAPMGWRIRNNTLFVEPVPTADELVVIDYVSRYPVVSEIRDGDYDLTKDPPQTVAPVVPRDGWLEMENADLLDSDDGATGARWDELPGWDVGLWGNDPLEALRRILITSDGAVAPEVRREEFTADDDKPAFDDDYFLSLGMTFRLRRSLGLPYAEQAAEYEEEMAVKMATDNGTPRSFRIGQDDMIAETLPLGDGRWLVS